MKISYPLGLRMMLRQLLLIGLAGLLSACSYFSFFSSKDDDNALAIYKRLQEARENDPSSSPGAAVDFPVRVSYSIKSKMIANQELEIEIEYLALKDIKLLKLGYTSTEGLALISKSSQLKYEEIKQHQLISQRIIVVPEEENLYYVNIIMITENAEEKADKKLQIPIALGKYSLKQGTTINK